MVKVVTLARSAILIGTLADLAPPAAVSVLSMVGKDYRLTKDMKHAAAALELPLAGTPITLRQAYADAPGQGTVVWRTRYRERDAAAVITADAPRRFYLGHAHDFPPFDENAVCRRPRPAFLAISSS